MDIDFVAPVISSVIVLNIILKECILVDNIRNDLLIFLLNKPKPNTENDLSPTPIFLTLVDLQNGIPYVYTK